MARPESSSYPVTQEREEKRVKQVRIPPSELMKNNLATFIIDPLIVAGMSGENFKLFDPQRFRLPEIVRVANTTGDGFRYLLLDGHHRTCVAEKYLRFLEEHKEDPALRDSLDFDFEFVADDVTDSIIAKKYPRQEHLTMGQYLLEVIVPTNAHRALAAQRIASHVITGWSGMVGNEVAKKYSVLAALGFLAGEKVKDKKVAVVKRELALLREGREGQEPIPLIADETPEKREALEKGLLQMTELMLQVRISHEELTSAALAFIVSEEVAIGGKEAAQNEILGLFAHPHLTKLFEKFPASVREEKQSVLKNALFTAFGRFKDKTQVDEVRTIHEALVNPHLNYEHAMDILTANSPKEQYPETKQSINRAKLYEQVARHPETDTLVNKLAGTVIMEEKRLVGVAEGIQKALIVLDATDRLLARNEQSDTGLLNPDVEKQIKTKRQALLEAPTSSALKREVDALTILVETENERLELQNLADTGERIPDARRKGARSSQSVDSGRERRTKEKRAEDPLEVKLPAQMRTLLKTLEQFLVQDTPPSLSMQTNARQLQEALDKLLGRAEETPGPLTVSNGESVLFTREERRTSAAVEEFSVDHLDSFFAYIRRECALLKPEERTAYFQQFNMLAFAKSLLADIDEPEKRVKGKEYPVNTDGPPAARMMVEKMLEEIGLSTEYINITYTPFEPKVSERPGAKKITFTESEKEQRAGVVSYEWVNSELPEEIDTSVLETYASEEEAKKIKERLIKHNLRLVIKVAKKYKDKVTSMEFMDLIQEGSMGLSHAIEKYDWRQGYTFSTYAIKWIIQYLQRAIINTDASIRIPKDVRLLYNKVWAYDLIYRNENGREAPIETVAAMLNINPEKVEDLRRLQQTQRLLSLEMPLGEGEDTSITLGEVIDDKTLRNDLFNRIPDESDANLEEALSRLPSEIRSIIELRYGLNAKQAQDERTIASSRGMGRKAVEKALSVGIQQLREYLT